MEDIPRGIPRDIHGTFPEVLPDAKHMIVKHVLRLERRLLFKNIVFIRNENLFSQSYTVTKISTNQIFVYKLLPLNDYCKFSFGRYHIFLKRKTKWLQQYSIGKKYIKSISIIAY